MTSPRDELPAIYNRQVEVASQCFAFGVQMAQRMAEVQMEGARLLLELQGQQFGGMEDAAGEDPSLQWGAMVRRAANSATEGALVCFRTAAAMQIEAGKLFEEFLPGLSRGLAADMERASQSVLAASRAEATRKRAA